MLVDRNTAKTRLISDIDALGYPALGESEINSLLDDAEVASVWAAETEYEFGAVIVPTAAKRVGCKFKVVAFDGNGVESGLTEPTWSDGRDATYSDGNITWQECGSQPSSLWDLNKAAYLGLMKKASKVQTEFDYGDADHKESASQMYKMLRDQAHAFRTVEVA
jgi:hypothetical protein